MIPVSLAKASSVFTIFSLKSIRVAYYILYFKFILGEAYLMPDFSIIQVRKFEFLAPDWQVVRLRSLHLIYCT